MLSIEQIKRLHEKYLELVKLEVETFGMKLTEVPRKLMQSRTTQNNS